VYESAPTPVRVVSEREAEERLARLYNDLDRLETVQRQQKLFEPRSPYQDLVQLRTGNVYTKNPAEEYLVLSANRNNTASINISDWYLESLVTENRAALPRGVLIPTSRRAGRVSNILLKPGENAYLISDDSPNNMSFHENVCTGYFTEFHSFSPNLRLACPYPRDEMTEFANIDLDNDDCYDFVETLNSCRTVDEDLIDAEDLSRRCELFVRDELTYKGCLANHGTEPLFDNVGGWHVYLDRRTDLWREKREIIRLMDERGRVIDVIEY
jgi:hypothetical protein